MVSRGRATALEPCDDSPPGGWEPPGRLIVVALLLALWLGRQAFVAGGDLKERHRHPEAEAGARLNRVMGQALTRLTQLPIPALAAVNGDAFGGGCEILTACDLRIAAPQARFSFAQAKNGLTTGWGGASRLAPLLGLSRALELLLTSRQFDAAEAQAMGLIHRIAADEDVLSAATIWADEILQLPRQALADLKQLAYAAAEQPRTAVNQLETVLFTNIWTHPDHLEAMAAFVEKRPPVFS